MTNWLRILQMGRDELVTECYEWQIWKLGGGIRQNQIWIYLAKPTTDEM
jgi:hypothetical protein